MGRGDNFNCMNHAKKKFLLATSALSISALYLYGRAHLSSLPTAIGESAASPAQFSCWPWDGNTAVRFENLSAGVCHWSGTQSDGTNCNLLEFDFAVNPNFKFQIAEQDAADKKPFDNVVSYWPRGAAQMTQQLNVRFANEKKGRVVALWNGLFFGYYEGHSKIGGTGFHVSPVVLNGKTHFT